MPASTERGRLLDCRMTNIDTPRHTACGTADYWMDVALPISTCSRHGARSHRPLVPLHKMRPRGAHRRAPRSRSTVRAATRGACVPPLWRQARRRAAGLGVRTAAKQRRQVEATIATPRARVRAGSAALLRAPVKESGHAPNVARAGCGTLVEMRHQLRRAETKYGKYL
jgi:hypothetical protein